MKKEIDDIIDKLVKADDSKDVVKLLFELHKIKYREPRDSYRILSEQDMKDINNWNNLKVGDKLSNTLFIHYLIFFNPNWSTVCCEYGYIIKMTQEELDNIEWYLKAKKDYQDNLSKEVK